ncbi:MAG: beta-ketoacyl-[acyl-carrier-protein] synthase II [Spirochaetes bacterium GWD1_27_9]|nr:MAG: beta-ketoacyl-[acyl-carrier-protein] synthase II [Spirochaetes bacterium GWB1_27_13]OHD22013.1 MAG: beta-ketoacyl-[acyl-carrier-protein] synthase II [Spirochaetes bacterium GWC1_27_15]OHD28646.1 MAG: beta-ketoacyl-[acyl-carrier-protein] synthase II [Spirochaetes bacterium GWD1_27_9]
MERRVVVTGIGTLNPLASDVETTWKKLLAGESGIDKITAFDVEGIRCQIGGFIKNYKPENFHIDGKIANKMDDSQQLAFAAMIEAGLMAKIPMHHPEDHSVVFPEFEGMAFPTEDPFRMGVMLGLGVGGIKTLQEQVIVMQEKGARRVSPFIIPKMIANLAGGWVTQAIGAMGVNTCYVTACASGTNALGEAFLAIKNDRADIIVSGGFEAAACRIGYSGFSNMHAMSTRNNEPQKASRPFDKARDGFVMGEGGAILVLEELEHAKKRGVKILAEFVGYGLTADAYHITSPEPEGKGAIRAMEDAIKMAGIKVSEIDYINAHGTSTGANDRMEATAIKKLFGDHAYKLSVSSTKSMSGHLLGGAGGFEGMVVVKSCMEDKVPPTINLDNPDDGMDLDFVPNKMKERPVNYAMSNSFGFGGHNAVIIVKKYKE